MKCTFLPNSGSAVILTEISIFVLNQIFLTEFLTKYKVWTLQLYNPLEVDAEWNYQKPADKRLELDKHMPLHLRRKMRKQQKPAPLVFDVMPANGCLRPKERQNIQKTICRLNLGHFLYRSGFN